jgi:hypothetical protein
MTNGGGSSVHPDAPAPGRPSVAPPRHRARRTASCEVVPRQSPARRGSPRRLPTTRGVVHRRGVPGNARPHHTNTCSSAYLTGEGEDCRPCALEPAPAVGGRSIVIGGWLEELAPSSRHRHRERANTPCTRKPFASVVKRQGWRQGRRDGQGVEHRESIAAARTERQVQLGEWLERVPEIECRIEGATPPGATKPPQRRGFRRWAILGSNQ